MCFQDIVQNDALTLLEENNALGQLISNLLKNVQKLVKQLLKDVDNLLKQLLGGKLLNLGELLNLEGLLKLDGLLHGILGSGNDGLLGTVNRLLDSLLGGGSKGGLLAILLGEDGVLGILLGDKGLVGGLLGENGLVGGLLNGKDGLLGLGKILG